MVAELITQCPKCQTSFKVRNEQLKVANGLVRCGSCLHVFNAAEFSALNDDVPVPPKLQGGEQLDIEDMFGPEDTISQIDQDFDLSDDSVNEMFSPSKTPAQKSPHEEAEEDASDVFLNISDDMNEDMDADELFGGETIQQDNQEQDDSWAEDLLKELDSGEDEEPPAVSQPEHKPEKNYSHEIPSPEDKHATSSPQNKAHIESEPVYLNTEPTRDKQEIYKAAAWGFGVFTAVLAILVQIAWLNFDQWSKRPDLRSIYSSSCQILSCELPNIQATDKIRASNLIVRSDSNNNKHLLIDAVISNQASFKQPFPKLALIFSNNDGKDIASGLILPNQYIGGELSGVTDMPINTPIHIAFKIYDPGANARSYRIEFYP